VLHHLLEATPEPDCGCCNQCAIWNTSRSSTSDQMPKIVQDIVSYTSEAFQKVRSCALESDFQLGYESALSEFLYEVSAAPSSLQLSPNARDDNREMANRRDEVGYEEIEAALHELAAEGRIYDTGERRWSERTQSHQVVWAAVPPKHKQH